MGKTITTYLIDGDPKGTQYAFISNKICQMFVCLLYTSTNNMRFYANGDVPFVKIEDTETKYIESCNSFITSEGINNSSAWIVPVNSIIYTNGATIGNVSINKIPVATKQGILGIIPVSYTHLPRLHRNT